MSVKEWLGSLLAPKIKAGPPTALSIRETAGWSGEDIWSGEAVTAERALALSAVWGCVNLLAGTIGSLPLMVYRKIGEDRAVAADHPLYRVLHDSPNYDQTAVDFWEYMQTALELWGNAYARIERSGDKITGLIPINPMRIAVRRLTNGKIEYSWSEDGRSWRLTDEDVFHIRGFGGGPLQGMSTLYFGRQAFGHAVAAERASASTFRNGMRPSVVLRFKNWLKPDEREIAEKKLAEKLSGAGNAGRPIVLEGDTEVTPLTLKPEDAQLLETRKFSTQEICTIFGVPPHMIGFTEKSTSWGTGIEQQTLAFQKFTLRRRLKRIEQAIAKQLLSPAERARGISVEFNMEGLLRADSQSRARFYQTMTQIGAMTINEVRALENLGKVDGGDVPRIQMQNQPITEADNADETERSDPVDQEPR